MTFAEVGIDTRGKTAGSIKVKCPKCGENRRGAKDLSVNISEGVWQCHYSKCNWKGSLHKSIQREEKQVFVRPVFRNNTDLSDKTVKWFQGRGISQATLNAAKVTEGEEWMPQVNGKANTVQFNYFRNGELVNTKFRDGRKNFKMVKDAELIFYNLDGITGYNECIITEGEIDALSFIEAGYEAVISVPNGATKGNANLEYIQNSWPQIEGIKRFYLAVDNDDAGLSLRDELARRLGKDVCLYVTYPEGCKDANEVLKFHGVDGVRDLVNTAKGFPLEDVLYLDDFRALMLREFAEGKQRGSTTYFPGIDPHFTWKRGEVTVMHGIPNHGKTNLMLQLMLAKSVHEGLKWGIFSPENFPPNEFYDDLIHAYIGKPVDPYYKNKGQMSIHEYRRGMDFIGQHFFYIYPDSAEPTQEYINQKFKELIIRYGIDGCLIDPYNQLVHHLGGRRDDQYLSVFLSVEKRFAQKHNVFKIIIAHPNRPQKNESGEYNLPTAYDLSGGAMWFNKCDNILVTHRPNYTLQPVDPSVEFHSQKIKKQKLVGIPGTTYLRFDRVSHRYFDNGFNPIREVIPDVQQMNLPESTFEKDLVPPF